MILKYSLKENQNNMQQKIKNLNQAEAWKLKSEQEIAEYLVKQLSRGVSVDINNIKITKDIFNKVAEINPNIDFLKFANFSKCIFSDLESVHFSKIEKCQFTNCIFEIKGDSGFEAESISECMFKKCRFNNTAISFGDMHACIFDTCSFIQSVITSFDTDDGKFVCINDTLFDTCSFEHHTVFDFVEFTGNSKFVNVKVKNNDAKLFLNCKAGGKFQFNKDDKIEGIIMQEKQIIDVDPEIVKTAVQEFSQADNESYSGETIEVLNQNSEDKTLNEFIEWYNSENKDSPTTLDTWEVSEKHTSLNDKYYELESKEFNEEYYVFPDRETAEIFAHDYFEDLVNDVGLGSEGAVNWDNMGEPIGYFNDEALEKLFDGITEDRIDYFVNGCSPDEQRTELEDVDIDTADISDEELEDYAEDYAEAYIKTYQYTPDNAIQYFIDIFGSFDEVLKTFFSSPEDAFDIGAVCNEVINLDGLGWAIAPYDGKEIEYKDIIIGRK